MAVTVTVCKLLKSMSDARQCCVPVGNKRTSYNMLSRVAAFGSDGFSAMCVAGVLGLGSGLAMAEEVTHPLVWG